MPLGYIFKQESYLSACHGSKIILVHIRIKGIEIVWISDGSGVYSQPPAQASAGIRVQSTSVVFMDEAFRFQAGMFGSARF